MCGLLWFGLDEADQLMLHCDGLFMMSFVIAFLFNWIWVSLSVLPDHLCAGRYGTTSPSDLLIIRWLLIGRFPNCPMDTFMVSSGSDGVWILGFSCFSEVSLLCKSSEEMLSFSSVNF